MSDRRIVLRLDDGSVVNLTWEPGAKFTLEVDESAAPKAEPVGGTQIEHLAPTDGEVSK